MYQTAQKPENILTELTALTMLISELALVCEADYVLRTCGNRDAAAKHKKPQ
jgi:hypothetical protein